MSMGLLFASIGAIVALLLLWAFWFAPRFGLHRLDEAQKGAMIAFQTVAALAILSAGVLYLEEQQWSPRLDVELKTMPELVPHSDPESALIQLAIQITNKTETRQSVNFIEVSAAGIAGPVRRDARSPANVVSTEVYRYLSSRPIEVGADETSYQFVEIPVACEWQLVRVTVRVPRPPAQPPQPGRQRSEYERKMMVSLNDVCSERH